MTVVELDGNPVVPTSVSSLDLSAGQRAGVLVTANQSDGGMFWISIMTRARSGVRTGTAVLVYNTTAESSGSDGSIVSVPPPGEMSLEQSASLEALQASQPAWNDWEFTMDFQRRFEDPDPNASYIPLPLIDDVKRTFVFLNTQERFLPNETDHLPPAGSDSSGIGIGDNLEEKPQCFCSQDKGFLRWTAGRKTVSWSASKILFRTHYFSI